MYLWHRWRLKVVFHGKFLAFTYKVCFWFFLSLKHHFRTPLLALLSSKVIHTSGPEIPASLFISRFCFSRAYKEKAQMAEISASNSWMELLEYVHNFTEADLIEPLSAFNKYPKHFCEFYHSTNFFIYEYKHRILI